MTEVEARQAGLHFTGKYESNYESYKAYGVKQEAADLREEAKKMGFKIRIVIVTKTDGKSLYADQAYRNFQTAKDYARQDLYLLKNSVELLLKKEKMVEDAQLELSNLKNDIMFAQERANKELSK